jgi:hypothetical protein
MQTIDARSYAPLFLSSLLLVLMIIQLMNLNANYKEAPSHPASIRSAAHFVHCTSDHPKATITDHKPSSSTLAGKVRSHAQLLQSVSPLFTTIADFG